MHPDEIIVNCFTSKPMTSNSAAKQAYSLFGNWQFPPSAFSDVEPIRNDWNSEQHFLDLWEKNACDYFGTILFKRPKKPRYQGYFLMQFGPEEKCHMMSMFRMNVGDFGEECLHLLALVDQLFETLEFDYAFVCTETEYQAANINLNVRISKDEIEPTQVVGMEWPDSIPGFYWANYFGNIYFDQGFGENLENLDQVVRLRNGVRVMNHGSITDWETAEARTHAQECVNLLGADWFFSKKSGMPSRRLTTDRTLFRWPKNHAAK